MAETKEDLQQQVKDLTRQLGDTQHALATLKLENQSQRDALTAAAAEKTELQSQLSDERTRSGDVAGELNEAENLIEDLQQRLKTAAVVQAQSDTAIVSDGTHHYKLLAPRFKYNHVQYTAAELTGNEQLVAELVAAGVGFLQKIDTEQ